MMDKYKFFKEFSGKEAVVTTYKIPDEIVMAISIDEAIEKFIKRNKLEKEDYDQLSDREWRLYIEKREILRKHITQVYYIKKED